MTGYRVKFREGLRKTKEGVRTGRPHPNSNKPHKPEFIIHTSTIYSLYMSGVRGMERGGVLEGGWRGLKGDDIGISG